MAGLVGVSSRQTQPVRDVRKQAYDPLSFRRSLARCSHRLLRRSPSPPTPRRVSFADAAVPLPPLERDPDPAENQTLAWCAPRNWAILKCHRRNNR